MHLDPGGDCGKIGYMTSRNCELPVEQPPSSDAINTPPVTS